MLSNYIIIYLYFSKMLKTFFHFLLSQMLKSQCQSAEIRLVLVAIQKREDAEKTGASGGPEKTHLFIASVGWIRPTTVLTKTWSLAIKWIGRFLTRNSSHPTTYMQDLNRVKYSVWPLCALFPHWSPRWVWEVVQLCRKIRWFKTKQTKKTQQ